MPAVRSSSVSPEPGPKPATTLEQFRKALAEDLRFLMSLHRQELAGAEFQEFTARPAADRFNLLFESGRFRKGLKLLDASADFFRDAQTAADALAADYTDIYLTHKCRAAPSESVWLDDDGLERQQPMFAVRKWYRKYGMAAADWRVIPDDHIALQLEFTAHLLEQDKTGPEPVRAAARFLDDHLLVWVNLFAQRVAERCATPFYAGLATVTAAYLNDARELMAELSGYDRPPPEKRRQATGPIAREFDDKAEDAAPQPYMPGSAPGW